MPLAYHQNKSRTLWEIGGRENGKEGCRTFAFENNAMQQNFDGKKKKIKEKAMIHSLQLEGKF